MYLQDATDYGAISEHVEIVVVPLTGWAARRSAFELASCGHSSRVLRERLPTRLSNLHPRGLDPASATADNHALAVRSRESRAHKVEYLPDRKAMRS